MNIIKTLNEVKTALIKCSENLCKECSYRGEYKCAVMMKQDAYKYLDSYSSYKEICEAEQERLKDEDA